MKLRGLLRFFILLLVFLSCTTSSLAQNNSAGAAISGTIAELPAARLAAWLLPPRLKERQAGLWHGRLQKRMVLTP